MLKPIVGIGGTHPSDLYRGYIEAASIMREAIQALRGMDILVPHMRDYPIMGGYDEATLSQRTRMIALEDVYSQYLELARHVKQYACGNNARIIAMMDRAMQEEEPSTDPDWHAEG